MYDGDWPLCTEYIIGTMQFELGAMFVMYQLDLKIHQAKL